MTTILYILLIIMILVTFYDKFKIISIIGRSVIPLEDTRSFVKGTSNGKFPIKF